MSSMRDMFVGITFRDEASRVINNLDRAMDNIDQSVRGFGMHLDDAHGDLRSMGRVGINATNSVESGFNDAEREARGFAREVSNSESALGKIKKVALGIGGAFATAFAVDKIKNFGFSSIEVAAGFQAMDAQFEQVFTGMQSSASDNLNKIANETGMLPERLKGSFTQIAAFAKTTGADTADALALTERATLAAADGAAFYDRSIEDVIENMQSFLKGNFENDAALGISATETTRNAKANQLYGKSFIKLDEAQKQLTLMAMVEEGNKLSGALGQASRESDAFENQLGNLKQSWTNFKGKIGGPLLQPFVNSMTDVSTWIEELDTDKMINKFERGIKVVDTMKETFLSLLYDTGEVSDLWQNFGLPKETSDRIESFADTMKTTVVTGIDAGKAAWDGFQGGVKWLIDNKDVAISGITGLAVAFGTLKVITTVKTAMDLYRASTFASTFATHGFNAALRANPIGMVVTGLGLLVAGGVMLYQNWDTVKEKTSQLWTKMQEAEGVIGLVLKPINSLIQYGIDLGSQWDSTRGIWGNVWNLMQISAGDAVNSVIGKINSMIETINKIPGVNIPVVAKVDWGDSKSGGAGGGGGAMGPMPLDGSHATGLENVPFDGYRAELHKGEAVLTAQQAGGLRQAGILSGSGNGTPKVNFDGPQPPSPQPQNGGSGSEGNRPSGHIFQITIHAVSDKAQDIKNAVREAVSDLLDEDLQTM
ncbi:MAG: hypothetical protein RR588_00460 [Solibacillus sp.]